MEATLSTTFLVYICIFQVSKLPEQPRIKRIKRLQTDFRPILKDFLSVSCLHKGFYYLNISHGIISRIHICHYCFNLVLYVLVGHLNKNH